MEGMETSKGLGGKERVYHKHCLKCNQCSKDLMGKFFMVEGEALCNNCAKKEASDIDNVTIKCKQHIKACFRSRLISVINVGIILKETV